MKTSKIIAYVLGILLLNVFITGCVPLPTGGGTPSPTNLFTVDLSMTGKYPTLGTEDLDTLTSKSIYIDGDTIDFFIDKYYGTTPGMAHSEFRAYINFPNHQYEYLLNNDSPYYTSISYNTIISNTNTPANTEWRFAIGTPGLGWIYEIPTGLGYASGGMSMNLINIEGLPLNEYRYWVFRKPKNGSYLYFWVKVIGIPDNMVAPNIVTIKIVNGRYQMDNIITGQ